MVNVANGTYYYMTPIGIFSCHERNIRRRIGLETISTKVWYQGPKGGVKYINDKHSDEQCFKYVTKKEKAIAEFIWIKLQAQPYFKG